MASEITGPPTGKVTNVSIVRDGDKFTVSWKVPSSLSDSSNSRRAETIDVYWYPANPQCQYYTNSGGNPDSFPPAGSPSSKFIATPWCHISGWMDEMSTSSTSCSRTFSMDPRSFLRGNAAKAIFEKADWGEGVKSVKAADRTALKNGTNLKNQASVTGIMVRVYAWNHYGYGGDYASAVFTTYKPKKPVVQIDGISDGRIYATCYLTQSNTDNYPAFVTEGYLTRVDNFNSKYKKETKIATYGSSVVSEREVSYDYHSWMNFEDPSQWVKFTFYFRAWGIGRATKKLSPEEKFATYTDWCSAYASASHVFGYPAQATINKIVYGSSNIDPTSLVTVKFKTNSETYHPVDSVKLQILKNSDATTAVDAGLSDGWSDVPNAVDNGNCIGLCDTMANAVPAVGKHVWYRLVTQHDNLIRYSVAVQAKALYRPAPSAADDEVVISSITPNPDGTSVTMVLGWNADDSTGTEVSWAEKEDAWESTAQPSTFNVTWGTAGSGVVPGKNRYAKVSVEGLTEGVPYYFRARRYLESESATSYGPYASYAADGTLVTVAPVSKPYSVICSVPEYTLRGKSLLVSWSYDANQQQKGWRIYFVRKEGEDTVLKLVADGEDAVTYKVISGAVLTEYAGTDAEVYVRVSVSTGGDWKDSLNAKTELVTAPGLKLAAPNQMNEMPYVFTVGTDQDEAEVVCKIKSYGGIRELPDKTVVETEDEVVWSDTVKFDKNPEDAATPPSWDPGKAVSVETGSGFDFTDGVRYRVEAQAVNRRTGLTSSVKSVDFRVRWAHQAIAPSKEMSYVSADSYEGGTSAMIFPGRPYGDSSEAVAQYGDTCSIYRVTAESVVLVAEGVPWDQPVTDIYAPYNKNGNLRYILATRSQEGDLNWIEVPYFMRNMNLRFDWGAGEYLEVPYNLSLTDKYDKNFNGYSSIDGGYSGSWNAGGKHKQSVSTDILKLDNAAQIEQVRKLGKYAGPVFVRTPDGQAFAANVKVDSVQREQKKPIMAVSFDCEEIDLPDQFKIRLDQ